MGKLLPEWQVEVTRRVVLTVTAYSEEDARSQANGIAWLWDPPQARDGQGDVRSVIVSRPEDMDPRELIRGMMRGNRSQHKLGYSPANAVLTVQRLHPGIDKDEMHGYSEGFSDGMLRHQPMWTDSDPDTPEHIAYRQGYVNGLREPKLLTYPSEQPI